MGKIITKLVLPFALLSSVVMPILAQADWSENLVQDGGAEFQANVWIRDAGTIEALNSIGPNGPVTDCCTGGTGRASTNIFPNTGNHMFILKSSSDPQSVASPKIRQMIDVSRYSDAIDGGNVQVRGGGWYDSTLNYVASCEYIYQFVDQNGNIISQSNAYLSACLNLTKWTQNEIIQVVPVSTRYINFIQVMRGDGANYVSILADDLYFNINATQNPPADPPNVSGVRGVTYAISKPIVKCKNIKTGKSVTVKPTNSPAWNCTSLGLKGKPGDKVQITVTGVMQ